MLIVVILQESLYSVLHIVWQFGTLGELSENVEFLLQVSSLYVDSVDD